MVNVVTTPFDSQDALLITNISQGSFIVFYWSFDIFLARVDFQTGRHVNI